MMIQIQQLAVYQNLLHNQYDIYTIIINYRKPYIKIYNFQELSVDFPINQLKQGFGKHVIDILNGLANLALKKNDFIYKKYKIIF